MVILLLFLELACSIPTGLLGPVCRITCSDQCAELLAQGHARNQWQQEEKSPDVFNISLGSVTVLSHSQAQHPSSSSTQTKYWRSCTTLNTCRGSAADTKPDPKKRTSSTARSGPGQHKISSCDSTALLDLFK